MENINMDIPFDRCPYTKEDANEALQNLFKYFAEGEKDKDFFAIDNLGVIDVYLNWPN